ncbi:MAG TPA: hypothetical protein VGI06_06355, partial [Acidimicrobiales bacterium]
MLELPPLLSSAPGLPAPRGPVSAHVLAALGGDGPRIGTLPAAEDDPLWGEDSALALYILYELHYRGFAGVDEAWEWDPDVLGMRATLERAFERRLRQEVGWPPVGRSEVAGELLRLAN